MSLINFLFYRKKGQSALASRKYGEHSVKPEELDKPLLAQKIGKKQSDNKTKKVVIVSSGRKPLIKILFEEDNKNL